MYRDIWQSNVKRLLADNKLSIAEAARLVGTSKQYLSAILAETEPTSMRERILDSLSLLLHATPARLYTPETNAALGVGEALAQVTTEVDAGLSPAEQAVLAERHFLAHEYGASYSLTTRLLKRHGGELTPAAVAQAELLAGKSACLFGSWEAAEPHLLRALAFWRKRLTAQPAKCLPSCLDTYRYLALAAHLAGDYPRALQLQTKALRLYKKYPLEASDLSAKWEAIALSALRTAARLSLSNLSKTVDELLAFCALAKLRELALRVQYELDFCQYALSRATMRMATPCEPPSPRGDLSVVVRHGLALWEREETVRLAALAQDAALDPLNPDQRFVQAWLAKMAAPQECHMQLEAEDSSVSRGLTSLALACQAATQGDAHGALHAWQNALYEFLLAREYPMYFLAYAGGLKQLSLAGDYREALQADLARRVRVFVQ
ncbi:MAG: hypothetical protein DDT39_01197 [Firmicutes bacterium]|nr:hypothetical protein [candidate division NPL-UPA2 bacterium]